MCCVNGDIAKIDSKDLVYKMTISVKKVKQIEYALSHGLTLMETKAYTKVSFPSVRDYGYVVKVDSVYQKMRPDDTKYAYFLLDFLAGTDEPLDENDIYKQICENRSGAVPKKDDLGVLLRWLESINIVSKEKNEDKIKYRLNDAPWM